MTAKIKTYKIPRGWRKLGEHEIRRKGDEVVYDDGSREAIGSISYGNEAGSYGPVAALIRRKRKPAKGRKST